MFNKTYINKTESNPVTRIIERSVSPDKVADLFLEAKREAVSQIIETVHVRNNIFEAAYIRFQDAKTLETVINWKIIINNTSLIGRVNLTDAASLMEDPVRFFAHKIIESQVDKMLEVIKK